MHVTGKVERVFGLDSVGNFRRCIEHIYTHNGDARAIICIGDLSNDSSVESCQLLNECLSSLSMDKYILLGNHDYAGHALDSLDDIQTEMSGFVQFHKLTKQGLFVFIDSVRQGSFGGLVCSARRAWLERILSDAVTDDLPVYLFMHHNPFPAHVASSNSVGLQVGAAFMGLLRSFRHTIKCLYYGHCHQTLYGEYEGIPFASLKGTSQQDYPSFSDDNRFNICHYEVAYNVIHMQQLATINHCIEFNRPIADII